MEGVQAVEALKLYTFFRSLIGTHLLFRVLPNFHKCFYHLIETLSKNNLLTMIITM